MIRRMSTPSTPIAPCFSRTIVGLAVLACSSFVLPVRASAQETTVTSRVAVFTGAGFGGEADVAFVSGPVSIEGSADLDATPIGGVRYEVAFLRYLAFGGELVASFWRGDGDARRNPMLDLAMTPRFRYPIVLNPRFMIEPYLVVPFGFSLAIWNDSVATGPELDRANPGLVVGALAGATFLTRSHVGAMLEFGWMHHVAYDKTEGGGRGTLLLNQAVLRAGVVYAF